MRALLIPLSLALPVAASHADPSHELSIGSSARALRSPSANAVTAKNLAGTAVGYAHDLGLALGPASVWAEASMTTGDVGGTMFQTLSTQVDALSFSGGLRARYALHRLVLASAHLALGAQRVHLDIADRSGISAGDHGWGAMTSAGAALELLARPGRLGFGLRVELGYVLAQPISLTPHRSVASDVLMLPMTDAALGKLDLGGPTLGASFLGQF